MLSIREYIPEDLEEILGLFYDTVHSVNARDYSPEELDAWAGGKEDREKWNMSLLLHLPLVAEFEGEIVGFGDIAPDGYLDRLYVRGDFQSRGAGTALCRELERRSGCARIYAHVSITARPFFERRGYKTVRVCGAKRSGLILKNYLMEKFTLRRRAHIAAGL